GRRRTRRFRMKALCLRPIAARWPVGSALLLLALAGPVMAAATISGTVTVPAGYALDEATVTVNDANNHLYRVAVEDTGAYKLDGVAAGTYTLTVQAKGSEMPPIQNLVLTDGQTLKQDLTLTAAKPFCFVKSPNPIPLTVGLGAPPTWYLYGAIKAEPAINGQTEPVSKHLLIQDRPNKDGQLVRIDIPWAIYLKGDGTTPITPPKDGDLGAAELAIDVNNPASTKDNTENPLYQLTWSGLDTGFGHANSLK